MLYRLLLIKFKYLEATCLFPIIINWEASIKAKYEMEIIEKILVQIRQSLGVSDVKILINRVESLEFLQGEFDSIIGEMNDNTPTSQIRTLSIEVKKYIEYDNNDLKDSEFKSFKYHKMHFPIRVVDHSKFVLSEHNFFPVITIEV